MAFSAKDIVYGSLVFFLVSLISFSLGQKIKTVKFIIMYLILTTFVILASYVPTIVRSMLLLIVLTARMCMPIMLYGQTFLKTTPVNEMITGMYAMKIPRPFIISFSVAMRFFPTAKEEIRNVRDAMTLRGTKFSLYNLRKRPGIIFEGFIVPLLVRSSTVADELSAASITRGLDNPILRTAFIKLDMKLKDIFITLIFVSGFVGIFIMKTVAGR